MKVLKEIRYNVLNGFFTISSVLFDIKKKKKKHSESFSVSGHLRLPRRHQDTVNGHCVRTAGHLLAAPSFKIEAKTVSL